MFETENKTDRNQKINKLDYLRLLDVFCRGGLINAEYIVIVFACGHRAFVIE